MELRKHPPSDSSLDLLLPAFERGLLRENLSVSTVRSYRWALEDLARFMRDQAGTDDVADLDRDLLERWQDHLRERPSALGGHLKAPSRSNASTAVRRLIRFAAEREMLDWRLERAVVRVRTVQNDPRPIEPDDLAVLQAHFSRPSTN